MFQPKDGSSIVVQSHRVDQSWRSWLFFNIIWKLILPIWRRVREKPAAGPQRLHRVTDEVKLRARGVEVGSYTLHRDLREDQSLGLKDWTLQRIAPGKTTPLRRTVVYWNGGGYALPSFPQHIDLESRLAQELDAQVLAIPYELAPYSAACLNFPRFVRICGQIAQDARASGHELIFAGDSAGGAIATAMIRAITELGPLLNKAIPVRDAMPDHLFLISPWLDATMSDSNSLEFFRINEQDYYLGSEELRECGRIWIGDEYARADALKRLPPGISSLMPKAGELSHPYLSPVLDHEHFRLLSQHGVRVTMSLGTRDITSLAGYVYLDRLEEAGVDTHFVEGIGGLHQYLLLQAIGLPEPSTAVSWMTAAVKRHAME